MISSRDVHRTGRHCFWALLLLTVTTPALAQFPLGTGTGPPANLKAGAFQTTVDLMWRASPTFRNQCGRLAARPGLRVLVRAEMPQVFPSVRARTEISRAQGTLISADVVLLDTRNVIELIAHELEHIVEQIEHVHLSETVCDGGWLVSASESCRAIEIGRRVAREVEESGLGRGSRR
jgi:hypothetical protein